MHIVDGARHFGRASVPARLQEVVRHQESPHTRQAERVGVKIPLATPGNVAQDKPVTARLNHNRWIADCPDCRGAEYVFLDEPLFWCADCQNVMAGHKWRPVVMPPNRQVIERIALARPMPHNRNWRPGESLASMRRENQLHGLAEELSPP